MSIFEMPDEVIWEMSLDNPRDDYEPLYVRPRPPKIIECRRCGAGNLVWVQQNNKWDLAYYSGPLKGKLHGCG